MDEFVSAVKRRFGERAIIQFEDFSNDNGKRLLERRGLPTRSLTVCSYCTCEWRAAGPDYGCN
jgi:hypothetical protein